MNFSSEKGHPLRRSGDPEGVTWNPTAEANQLVTVRDARRMLGGISSQTIYRLVHDGDLTIVKIRRRSFIRTADLAALINRGLAGNSQQALGRLER